jgi:flagellar basal body-associated protein FliL
LEGKGSFFNIVLLFILAFLALTLAVLAGYIFIGGGSKPTTVIMTQAQEKKHLDADFSDFELYTEKTLFNLKATSSGTSASTPPIIQAIVSLKYLTKAPTKTSSIKDTTAKLTKYKGEIQSLIGSYFMSLTAEEAQREDSKESARKVLIVKINNIINANEAKQDKIVFDVIFPYWAVF